MAEHNALVTDTHPLVFYGAGGKQLSRRAAAHFEACDNQEAIVYVPVAVIWECCSLVHAGKVDLKRSPQTFFEELFDNPAYQPLDLNPEQVYLADQIRPNRDPFDALICAAANCLGLPLITRDGAIEASGLSVVW